MKKGLGMGLEALFEDNNYNNKDSLNEKTFIKISDIEPNKDQPRKDFDQSALEQLSESIKEHGVIQPLIVSRLTDGRYKIIAGERRFRASRMAGLSEVPVVIRDYDERQIMEVALVENLQREDLSAYEAAKGYKELMDNYGLSQEQVAKRVSKSRSAVANTLRLLTLPEKILDYVIGKEITEGHARAIMALKNEDEMDKAANIIIEKNMSVRQAEALVKNMLMPTKKKVKTLDNEVVLAVKELEKRLESTLGNKIKIKHNANNSGKIEIKYQTNEELDKIIEIITK